MRFNTGCLVNHNLYAGDVYFIAGLDNMEDVYFIYNLDNPDTALVSAIDREYFETEYVLLTDILSEAYK